MLCVRMAGLPGWLLGGVVVALAAALHLAFWRWRLRLRPCEDELLFARTRDSWELALGRCRPAAPARLPPVLLVHGIGMNRQAFELGVPGYSLAAHLAAAGLDCFSIDLRGHGASRRVDSRAPRRIDLDAYLAEDLPAALEAIRRATGAEKVLLVGHSQGAVLGLAAAATHGERIAGLVALAAPVHFDAQPRLRALLGRRRRFRRRYLGIAARTFAPFSGHWHPPPTDLALNLRNVEPRVTRRVLANAIEDLHPGELEQFATFAREDSFRSMDGSWDYRAALERCRQPALFVAAPRDELAPPAAVESSFRRWGGPKRYVVLGDDYGHTDILVGRRAPEEVFPLIRDFLLGLSQPDRARLPHPDPHLNPAGRHP
jgi:pimeloyl-ACP methyl ester carboxylesterase